MGTNRFHICNDALHDMDRAQCHKEASRPLGFLTNHAVLERNTFIEIAGLKASRSKACQDSVTPAQTCSSIGGGRDDQFHPPGSCHLLGNGLNDTQAFCIKINENDLRSCEILPLLDERGHCAGGSSTAPTNVGQFYTCHTRFSFIL